MENCFSKMIMRFVREHPGWTAILAILIVIIAVLTIDQYSYFSPSIPFVGQRIAELILVTVKKPLLGAGMRLEIK